MRKKRRGGMGNSISLLSLEEAEQKFVRDLLGLTAEEMVATLVKDFKIKPSYFLFEGFDLDFREVLGELLTRLGVRRWT